MLVKVILKSLATHSVTENTGINISKRFSVSHFWAEVPIGWRLPHVKMETAGVLAQRLHGRRLHRQFRGQLRPNKHI